MFERSVKWTSILFLALCLGVVLLTTGCLFGGGGSATTTLSIGTGGTVGTITGAAEGQPLHAIDGLPQQFVQALANRPIVVLFYISGNADDTSVLDTVNRLSSSFSSYVFLTYDYKNPDSYGTLTSLLDIPYTPYVALIDGAGAVQKVFSGYVDEGSLNQALVNLGKP